MQKKCLNNNNLIEEIVNELKKNSEAIYLDSYNKKHYFLVKNKKVKKKLNMNKENIKVIEANKGFLDPKWEKELFEKKNITLEDRAFIEIYDAFCHYNIFKYANKEHINDLIGKNKFYSTPQLKSMLENYMQNKGYKFYYCNDRNIDINTELIRKYSFIKQFDKIAIFFDYINHKFPGFVSKICFFFIKKINQIIKIKKIKNIDFIKENNYMVKEIMKREIKFGCLYYEIKNSNCKVAFLKGFDYFKVAKNEAIANKKIDSKYKLKLINTDNENFTIYEYIKSPTLDEYINNNNKISFKETKLIINRLYDILEELYRNEIIHRDIREENILLILKNNEIVDIKLIDFGYSIFQKQEYLNYNNIFAKKVLKSLGNLYKPDLYVWDDSVEVLNLLENLNHNIYVDFKKEIEKIEKIKGRYTVSNGGIDGKSCFFDFTL